jgi:hypothetical protein
VLKHIAIQLGTINVLLLFVIVIKLYYYKKNFKSRKKKKQEINWYALHLIIGLALFFNMYGSGWRYVINSIGVIVLSFWLIRISSEDIDMSKYVKERIFYEGLYSISLSIISALIVVSFIQRDIFPDKATLFLGLSLLSIGIFTISTNKLGKIRSSNNTKFS